MDPMGYISGAFFKSKKIELGQTVISGWLHGWRVPPPPRIDFIYDASNHQHQFHISIDLWIYTYSPARSISVIGEHPNSERSPNASLQHKMVLAIKSSKQNVVASSHLKKYARLAFPISLVFRVRMTRTYIYINSHHVNKERCVVSLLILNMLLSLVFCKYCVYTIQESLNYTLEDTNNINIW